MFCDTAFHSDLCYGKQCPKWSELYLTGGETGHIHMFIVILHGHCSFSLLSCISCPANCNQIVTLPFLSSSSWGEGGHNIQQTRSNNSILGKIDGKLDY